METKYGVSFYRGAGWIGRFSDLTETELTSMIEAARCNISYDCMTIYDTECNTISETIFKDPDHAGSRLELDGWTGYSAEVPAVHDMLLKMYHGRVPYEVEQHFSDSDEVRRVGVVMLEPFFTDEDYNTQIAQYVPEDTSHYTIRRV